MDGEPDPIEIVAMPTTAPDPTPEPLVGHATAGYRAPEHDRDHEVPGVHEGIAGLIEMAEDLVRRCGSRHRAYQDAMWPHLAPRLAVAYADLRERPRHPMSARWRARIALLIPSLAH